MKAKTSRFRSLLTGWLVVAMIIIIGVTTGCSEDPDPDHNLLSNGGNDGDEDVGLDVDAADDVGGDADGSGDAEGDAGDVGEDTNGEVEYPIEVDGPCGPMIDLGELSWGQEALQIDFNDFDNDLELACDSAVTGSAAAVYRFDVPSAATGILSFESAADLAAEIRLGGCGDDVDRFGCYDDDFEMAIQPGLTHHLVIRPTDSGVGSPVEATLSFEEMPTCFDDQGEASCVDSSRIEACQFLQTSPDVPRLVTAECPDGNCVGDRCRGDSCDDPIVVTSSFAWSGRNYGFFDNQNSHEEVIEANNDPDREPTCFYHDEVNDEIEMLDTKGRELVFEVRDLQAGDEVDIAVEFASPDDVVILVKEECSDTSECLDTWFDYEEATFVAPWAGDFFVIIDTMVDFDGYFEISIEIN